MALIGGNPAIAKRFPILSKSFTTGLCGSLTTFSTWMYAIAGAQSYAAAVEEVISGLCLPLMFFLFGKELINIIASWTNSPQLPKAVGNGDGGDSMVGIELPSTSSTDLVMLGSDVDEERGRAVVAGDGSGGRTVAYAAITQPPFTTEANEVSVSILVAVLLISLLIAANFMLAIPNNDTYSGPSQKYVWYCLWGPVGAIPRYFLSNAFNTPHSKKGTLYANVFAVLLYGILLQVNHLTNDRHAELIGPIIGGTCGSLSTVSSFVADTLALREIVNDRIKAAAATTTSPPTSISTLEKYVSVLIVHITSRPIGYYLGTVCVCLIIALVFQL